MICAGVGGTRRLGRWWRVNLKIINGKTIQRGESNVFPLCQRPRFFDLSNSSMPALDSNSGNAGRISSRVSGLFVLIEASHCLAVARSAQFWRRITLTLKSRLVDLTLYKTARTRMSFVSISSMAETRQETRQFLGLPTRNWRGQQPLCVVLPQARHPYRGTGGDCPLKGTVPLCSSAAEQHAIHKATQPTKKRPAPRSPTGLAHHARPKKKMAARCRSFCRLRLG